MEGIFLQEYGQKGGANRPDYKLFYATDNTMIQYLPTLTSAGNWDYFVKSVSAKVDINPIKVGDQVLIWKTGQLKTMMPDNKWKAIGE